MDQDTSSASVPGTTARTAVTGRVSRRSGSRAAATAAAANTTSATTCGHNGPAPSDVVATRKRLQPT
nr:hypothetical protein DA06_19010 [Georgenia sp. SUBG003]